MGDLSTVEAAAILGVGVDTPIPVVKHAFRQAARAYHPDGTGGGNVDAFLAAKAAYDALMDAAGNPEPAEDPRHYRERTGPPAPDPPSTARKPAGPDVAATRPDPDDISPSSVLYGDPDTPAATPATTAAAQPSRRRFAPAPTPPDPDPDPPDPAPPLSADTADPQPDPADTAPADVDSRTFGPQVTLAAVAFVGAGLLIPGRLAVETWLPWTRFTIPIVATAAAALLVAAVAYRLAGGSVARCAAIAGGLAAVLSFGESFVVLIGPLLAVGAAGWAIARQGRSPR